MSRRQIGVVVGYWLYMSYICAYYEGRRNGGYGAGDLSGFIRSTLWRLLLPYGYNYKASWLGRSFVISDIRALWRSVSPERQSARVSKITNDRLNQVWHRMLCRWQQWALSDGSSSDVFACDVLQSIYSVLTERSRLIIYEWWPGAVGMQCKNRVLRCWVNRCVWTGRRADRQDAGMYSATTQPIRCAIGPSLTY